MACKVGESWIWLIFPGSTLAWTKKCKTSLIFLLKNPNNQFRVDLLLVVATQKLLGWRFYIYPLNFKNFPDLCDIQPSLSKCQFCIYLNSILEILTFANLLLSYPFYSFFNIGTSCSTLYELIFNILFFHQLILVTSFKYS